MARGRWQTVAALFGVKTDTLEAQTLLQKHVCVFKVTTWDAARAAPHHLKPQTLTAFTIKAFFFFFTLMPEPLTRQSSPPSWGNAFWFRSRACREGLGGGEKKQWKSTGKSPSAVRRKAYRVSRCCAAVLLVLACCWWTVLCGWGGLCRARMEAPADPVSSVMDDFGWKLLVVLRPFWLHACFTRWCWDPLVHSEHSPLQLLAALFIQLNSLTQNTSSKKKKEFKSHFSRLFTLI